MSNLNIGRRIVRPIVIFVVFALFVTIGPALNVPREVTRVVSIILLGFVVVSPFLPARSGWEVPLYFSLLGAVVIVLILAVLWARFW